VLPPPNHAITNTRREIAISSDRFHEFKAPERFGVVPGAEGGGGDGGPAGISALVSPLLEDISGLTAVPHEAQ
jgi:hypothetical protein